MQLNVRYYFSRKVGKSMKRGNSKKNWRRILTAFLVVVMFLGGSTGLGMLTGCGIDVVQAATLAHTEATVDDVVNGNFYNSKGLQGTEFAALGDSVSNLNLNHIMLNVDLNSIINTDGTGTPYVYNGKTYYFNEQEGSMMKVLLSEVKTYREQGIVWTFCLVLSWSDDPVVQNLMYNPVPGKVYYALDSTNPEAKEHIAAILHYMAERFGYSDTFVQNWRVGNEVNVASDYNYTGATGVDVTPVLEELAIESYNLLHDALCDENPYARAYVSITHDWNNSNEGRGVPTKKFLDDFAAGVTDKSWNVDFHAYPPQMSEQVWTKASAQYLSHDVETPFICGADLEVLTEYIKQKNVSQLPDSIQKIRKNKLQ